MLDEFSTNPEVSVGPIFDAEFVDGFSDSIVSKLQ
jgi:hypothetical protein